MKQELTINENVTVISFGQWEISDDVSIDCYVTENGQRLMSLRGTARAMGLSGSGSVALLRNLKSNYLQKYLSEDLKDWINCCPSN